MGFGKDGRGAIVYEQRVQALGALANATGIIVGTKLAIVDDFRMLKSEVNSHITGLTTEQSTGLELWLAHGDLTLSEVEAALELNGPLARGEVVDEATAQRPVFRAGMYVADGNASTAAIAWGENGSPLPVLKPRWTWPKTKSWNWIVYNRGVALTTGATARLFAKSYGVWII